MKPQPMKFHMREIAPHVVVEVTIEGVWKWRLAMVVMKAAVWCCTMLGAEVAAVLHRKSGKVP